MTNSEVVALERNLIVKLTGGLDNKKLITYGKYRVLRPFDPQKIMKLWVMDTNYRLGENGIQSNKDEMEIHDEYLNYLLKEGFLTKVVPEIELRLGKDYTNLNPKIID